MKAVLKIGSYAMETYEIGQVWKEAAISSDFDVPWGSLIRASFHK